MAQSVVGTWTAVYNVLAAMFPPPVLVSMGDPGSYQPDVIVAVMGGRYVYETPVMTPARPRERICEVEVIFSVYQPGGDPSQSGAWTLVQTMVDQFDAYFKTAGNETLGGACRNARPTVGQVAFANTRDPESANQTGSTAEVTVTVTAWVRR